MEVHPHPNHSAPADRLPSGGDQTTRLDLHNVQDELHQHALDMRNMTAEQRQQIYARLSPREAASILPELSLTPPSDQTNLPKHQMQTDNGLGTRDNPINNNCQTTTLKNLFNFYGMDGQSPKVNDWQTSLLHDIRDRHGKDIDIHAIEHTFERDARGANDVKNAIRHGQLSSVFQNDTMIKQSHERGSAASPAVASLFLSEMGCKPEQVSLGSRGAARHVQDALDSGKPIMIGDNNTHTLLQRALAVPGQPPKSPAQGHVYMAYKIEGRYYVADPGYPHPVQVSAVVLQEKLMDRNSQATIINRRPDPSKFLHH